MSKQLKKIYTSGGWNSFGWLNSAGFQSVRSYEEADVIGFPGGQDINPRLYGQKVGIRTYPSLHRDEYEVADFKRAVKDGKKIIGICRGLQLICALSGGRLIQDVANHHGTHEMAAANLKGVNGKNVAHLIQTDDYKTMRVNSIHHQMIYPYNLDPKDYTILGWTKNPISSRYLNGANRNIVLPMNFVEIEICKFHKTNSLGWQYHPEMMGWSHQIALEHTIDTFIRFYNDEI